MNSGDDIAGYVEKVGKGVYEFKKGDRVAAFHQMVTPHGSFAEYAIAPAHTTFHLAENVSLEEVRCSQFQMIGKLRLQVAGSHDPSRGDDSGYWIIHQSRTPSTMASCD